MYAYLLVLYAEDIRVHPKGKEGNFTQKAC